MLLLGKKAADEADGREKIRRVLQSGAGLAKFKELIAAQHGSTSWIGKRPLTKAAQQYTAVCTDEGYITAIHGRALGEIAMKLGAGRAHKEDAIDPMVGIRLYKELYDPIHAGEPLFTIYGKADTQMMAVAQQIADQIIVTPTQAASIEPVVCDIIYE